jgi:hypothetical protein
LTDYSYSNVVADFSRNHKRKILDEEKFKLSSDLFYAFLKIFPILKKIASKEVGLETQRKLSTCCCLVTRMQGKIIT